MRKPFYFEKAYIQSISLQIIGIYSFENQNYRLGREPSYPKDISHIYIYIHIRKL